MEGEAGSSPSIARQRVPFEPCPLGHDWVYFSLLRRIIPGMTRSTHSYGSHPSQLGELFLPDGSGPFGVAVVVHGGYWKAQYDRSLMTDLCIDLAAHGLAAWNVEYRRVGGGGGWPDTFLDVAACIDLLADLDAPLDLERVVAVGHSAGGQLALWAPGARRCRTTRREPTTRPDRGRSLAGRRPRPRTRRGARCRPRRRRGRCSEIPREHHERYVLASPRERLPLGIPQLVLHGDRDDTVSLRIATSYASAARAAGDPCELVVLTRTRPLRAHRRRRRGVARREGLAARSGERAAQLSDEAPRAPPGRPRPPAAPPSRRRRRPRARPRRRPARALRCRIPRTAARPSARRVRSTSGASAGESSARAPVVPATVTR